MTSDHEVLTRGWLDAAHHVSLRFTTPLRPDRWYTVTVPLNAYDVTVAAGTTVTTAPVAPAERRAPADRRQLPQ